MFNKLNTVLHKVHCFILCLFFFCFLPYYSLTECIPNRVSPHTTTSGPPTHLPSLGLGELPLGQPQSLCYLDQQPKETFLIPGTGCFAT